MDRTQMVYLLKSLLEEELTKEASIITFGERGVLTSNEGLYVRLTKGTEFQITVVQKNLVRRITKLQQNNKERKYQKRKMDNPQSTDERNVFCR